MTRPTWSTKGRFIGLRVRNVGGTRERIARSGPISTFDTHIILYSGIKNNNRKHTREDLFIWSSLF